MVATASLSMSGNRKRGAGHNWQEGEGRSEREERKRAGGKSEKDLRAESSVEG